MEFEDFRMKKTRNFLSAVFGYFLLMLLTVNSSVEISLDNNFESGTLYPWIEQSNSGVKWKIENRNSPFEPENGAPLPSNGTNYLRVDRGTSLAFGLAILRSPVFTILPGDAESTSFSFSFWIRSKWPQFTNLELYLAKNGNEILLLNLYEYSDVNNQVWQSQTISITDDSSSNLTLVFYAYCGTDTEDAVAIDDLSFITLEQSTSTTTSSWTSTTTSMSSETIPSTTSIFSTTSSFETESTSFETESTSFETDYVTSTTSSTKSTRPSIRTTTPSTTTRRFTTKTTSTETESTNSTDDITTDPTISLSTEDMTTNLTEETTTDESTDEPTTSFFERLLFPWNAGL